MPTRANTYKLLDELMRARAEAGALRASARLLRQRGMVDVDVEETLTDAT